jgi:hypothetical protein
MQDEIICNKNVACGSDYTCLERGNPAHGMHNADNLLFACLMVFEIITLEGWAD